MRNLINIQIFLSIILFTFSCMDDKGNYDYNYDIFPDLIIDTSEMDKTDLYRAWYQGDTVNLVPKIIFDGDMNNLIYRWIVMPSNYQAITVGNSQVWPVPDTISYTLELNYIVNLQYGTGYQLYFMAKDTVTGNTTYFKISNYLSVPEAGTLLGIYCLQEKEGKTDIDVFGSSRALILTDFHEKDYYSFLNPSEPLTGKPKLLGYSKTGGYFYIFTDNDALRVAPSNMVTMETWDEMFFTAPVYAPEAFQNINSTDFLINDGKLYVLYVSAAGDRRFPIAIPGNYDLAPFLSQQTINSYNGVVGAINAYQIVFDYNTNGFKPFFNRGTALSRFSENVSSLFDVNNMEGEIVFSTTTNGGETMAIMKREEGYFIDVANFYDVVDDGNLARVSKSLDGLVGLENAGCFIGSTIGPVFFYGSGSNVYSYSYISGQTNADLLWEGEAGDEITCMQLLSTGGFPTAGRILWIAVWNEGKGEGKLVEFEIEPTTGYPDNTYTVMFGKEDINPVIHEGFGKIYFMVEKSS